MKFKYSLSLSAGLIFCRRTAQRQTKTCGSTRGFAAQNRMCEGCRHCDGSGFVKTAETTCMEIFREMTAEHRAEVNVANMTTSPKNTGVYVLTSNAEVVDRLLDEEATVYQALVAKMSHEVRLEVDSAYRHDQFDLVFVPGLAS